MRQGQRVFLSRGPLILSGKMKPNRGTAQSQSQFLTPCLETSMTPTKTPAPASKTFSQIGATLNEGADDGCSSTERSQLQHENAAARVL